MINLASCRIWQITPTWTQPATIDSFDLLANATPHSLLWKETLAAESSGRDDSDEEEAFKVYCFAFQRGKQAL